MSKGKTMFMYSMSAVLLNVYLIDKFLVKSEPLKVGGGSGGHPGVKLHQHGHRSKARPLEDAEYDRLKAFFHRKWPTGCINLAK